MFNCAPPIAMVSQVHQWTFKNNGMVFRDEDWSRLKKIGGLWAFYFQDLHSHPAAEGNPDEEKIGAFGVGVSLHKVAQVIVVLNVLQGSTAYSPSQKNHL